MLRKDQLILGGLENNCYLVQSADGKTLYIIDPAADGEQIAATAHLDFAFDEAVILLTHAHADHIGAVKEVKAALQVKTIMLSPADEALYRSPDNAILPYLAAQTDLPATVAPIDTADFKVIALPGHTAGGVGYYFAEPGWLFAGDTIFYRSVGRTDLGGDATTLTNSIRENIFTLPDEVVIFPGHGPETTVGMEKKANPYV